MVPQMIVCVGDEDGESHPPPEFVQIIGGPGGDHLDRGSDVQVAPDIAVPSFEHRHRAHVADPTVIFTVESTYDQHAAVSHTQRLRLWDVDARVAGEMESDTLPGGHIPFIEPRARELRDGDAASVVYHVCLRACTTQRTSATKKVAKLLFRLLV